jgi:Protein of unknown function (DUF4058)
MPSPFPGMDPYLEQPTFWSSFHFRLIGAMASAIAPRILPKYYIEVETRTYSEDTDPELLVGIPDAVVFAASENRKLPEQATDETASVALQNRPQPVRLPIGLEVRERYLEVREIGTDSVITVIEVLSPKNKRTGKGRIAYEEKRQRVLNSTAHLVELDLLRSDVPMPMIGAAESWDYRILISRSEQRPMADLYGFNLQEPIPSFPLPLKPEDIGLDVNLQPLMAEIYDEAGYQYRLGYQRSVPLPRLSLEDQQWVDQILMLFRGE